MSDDTDDDQEPTDTEELVKTIAENRDERKEQVSFGWVETVREAGEVYRTTEAIDDVARGLDLSVETTREALTVYRLVFQERSQSATKSARVGRAYFSLSRDVADQYDPEDNDEPLEELLCEYVGALYLDHDINKTPVGDPPDESTPPPANVFAELDTDKIFQFPTAATLISDGAISDAMMTQSEIASIAVATGASEAIQQDILGPLSASVGISALPEGMMAMLTQPALSQNVDVLSKIVQFQGFAENIATTSSMFSGLAEAAKVSQPPDSLFADLATVQAAAIPPAEISEQFGGGLADGIEHQPQPEIGGDEVEKESASEIENDGEPDLETSPEQHTEYPNWEARIAESHIDPTPSNRSATQTDVGYEMPVTTVYSMVSEGETYQWLSSMAPSHRTAVIQALLHGVAFAFGVSYPSMAGIFVDVIHGSVLTKRRWRRKNAPGNGRAVRGSLRRGG